MKVETRLALVLTTEKILAIIKVLKKDIKKGLNETQKSQNFGFKSYKKGTVPHSSAQETPNSIHKFIGFLSNKTIKALTID